MCFKTVRLTSIRNGPKWITFASGELVLLQMVSKPALGGVPVRMLGPQGGGS